MNRYSIQIDNVRVSRHYLLIKTLDSDRPILSRLKYAIIKFREVNDRKCDGASEYDK